MRKQSLRVIASGLSRGLLLFLPWVTFRYFWLWQMPFNRPSARAHLTDVEFRSLDLEPGSDFYLLLSLVGFAVGLSLLFSFWPDRRQQSKAWILAAGSFALAAFSTFFFPVLVTSNRLPGATLVGSIERIAWAFVFVLTLGWILTVSILRSKDRPS